MISPRTRRVLREDNGSSLVEMAVSVSVMFLFFFCFMELCIASYTHDMIAESAREGTRYAMYRGASCPTSSNPTCEVTAAQVNTYVNNLGWPNLGGGTMTVATTYPSGNEAVGSRVQVQITYVFPIRMPLVPHPSLSMTIASQATILQ